MTEETIFKLLRASLFTDEPVELDDWESVFSEMEAQAVAALPGDWLKRHPFSGDSEWKSYCRMVQSQWVRVMCGQQELLQLLEKHGIPCVILKGAAAGMAYPQPSLRSMGDVDFLVKRADFEKTAKLLESSGFQLAHEPNPDHHHIGYTKDDISYELHRKLGIVLDSDEKLLSLFEDGIDKRQFREMEGDRFPVLPDALNGLVLVFHINQHLRSGLGLRQIIDWMMYIDKLPEDTRRDELLPLLRETGMERLALTVTAMCQKYLGLRTIVENPGLYPCDELMSHIMEKGNFGRKAGKDGKIAEFSLSSTDSGHFFRRLQAGGLARWKAAKKHAVLRPFAWLYQGVRISGLFIRNGMSPKRFSEQRRKGLEQRELMEALGLKVDREIVRDGEGGKEKESFI